MLDIEKRVLNMVGHHKGREVVKLTPMLNAKRRQREDRSG